MNRQFIHLNRVCVPLSLECDLNCRYCYRNSGRISDVPPFTEDMKEFLRQLNPDTCQAVVASGGEPLLHFDRVRTLFENCPARQHKKIMTNGLNLTQEIVDYINSNDIETWVSYDGDVSAWTRGVDILQDEEILRLVRAIQPLTVSCVCTAKNPDPYECYCQIKRRLGRDFYFHFNAVFGNQYLSPLLVDGFDYEKFFHGYVICKSLDLDYHNPIKRCGAGLGTANVLPDGTIVGMAEIHHRYGSIFSTREEILESQRRYGDRGECDNTECPIHSTCWHQFNRSDHWCRIQVRTEQVNSAIRAVTDQGGYEE